jgi:predicted nucleic acid-binding protein
MIVVDTNILAYFYLPRELTASAEKLLQQEPEWAAPILWRSEFRNVLTGYLRRNYLNLTQAREIQQEAESLMTGLEFEVDSASVLTLVCGSDCSAYDCELVVLAKQLNTVLLTMDKKLLQAFPEYTAPLNSR